MPNRIPTHQPLRPQFKTQRTIDRPRLSSAQRGYGRRWQRLAALIRQRDHYLCQACGAPAGAGAAVDHIVPRARGGSDDPANLQTLCRTCHSRKTAGQDGGFGNRPAEGGSKLTDGGGGGWHLQ